MRPQLTDRKPLALLNRGLAVTAALAALLMAASFWLGARNKSDDEWVLHTLAVRSQLTQLRTLVQAAETGQRGYLITSRETYLTPYENAVAAFPASLDGLEKLVSDNPAQEQSIVELRQLIKDKLDELRSTVDEAKAGHADAARAIVNSDSGLRLMQEINRRLAGMDAEEDRLLSIRRAAAERSGTLLLAGVALAFVLICLLGALVARFTRQSFGALTVARDQQLVSNTRLLEQIARREQVESQLRQSQKMEALGQLTGGIAHDFNNMLGVIMGAHDLMSRRIRNGDFGIQRFMDAATSATERAAVLTQRLLAFARQQPLAPQPIDANKMIGNMSDLLHSTLGEHIQIETVTAAGLWMIHADLQQLESAVLNIAINARDAMPDGGKLTIETANAYLDDDYCRQNPEFSQANSS